MEKSRMSSAAATSAVVIDRDDDESTTATTTTSTNSAGLVFYFIKCRLGFDGVDDARWEHLTRLFRPNEPINELIQIRIDE